ncbi:LAT2 domain-containing protein [Engraulis encrasicolus]|uniref:LAT2 domain-containing protein n=1 Tax=Engraulis encrasicolus TaxID=184585 RepID=UPI002FD2C998
MLSTLGQQGLVLALALLSLVCMGLLCVLCFWCRRRRNIITEDNQLYDPREPPVIHREGSKFAVTRSKTVIRPNQITRSLPPEPGSLPPAGAQDEENGQCSYQNVPQFGTFEPTYVDPIPGYLYGNITDVDHCSYENVFPTPMIQHNSDGDDYENAEFLENHADDTEDEPDYVNQMET